MMMKHLLFTQIFFFTLLGLQAQNTLSATYTIGEIPTSFDTYDESCNGPSATLSITLPAGDNYTVTSVDVAYDMTAKGGGWMSDQRSLIKFQNTNAEEATEAVGEGDEAGTQMYARTMSIANGSFAGSTEFIFEMRVRRTWEGDEGCNTLVNRVDATTWTITVHFSDVMDNPKVGVSTTTPSQALDVAGKLKLSDDNTVPQPGTVRWNAATGDFEGYNGIEWLSFTKNEGGSWGNKEITENSSELASDGVEFDYFGYSVALSGDYAIVGAYGNDALGTSNQGKAYIFKRTGTGWAEQAGIVASDGAAGYYFGLSMSLSGDYAIVGAYRTTVGKNNQQGKVYYFSRD
jgi:hypothetical protein